MMTIISRMDIQNLLNIYYKNKYSNDWTDINVIVFNNEKYETDRDGFLDKYYQLSAYIVLEKNVLTSLPIGNSININKTEFINESEIKAIIKEMFIKDGLYINYINVSEYYIYLYFDDKLIEHNELDVNKIELNFRNNVKTRKKTKDEI